MKFEICSKYAGAGLALPVRKTAASAGYDFQVAKQTKIPSYFKQMEVLKNVHKAIFGNETTLSLKNMEHLTKLSNMRPTLVPTGIKCELPSDYYLELSMRSSCPLKYWLILANGVGIIDADYYNNPDNEGEIFFQVINLSPYDIILDKGDTIGQGIIKPYYIADNDTAKGERTGGFGSTDQAVQQLVEIGLPYPVTPEECKLVVDKILSFDSKEKVDEECVMACNPERRAYIFGAPKETENG